ncbi:ubiquinone biosynthesis protein COQ4 homolog, mitochondrial [Culicoides brevitarsis]|uniref:ubiquinone biosynthesis protein COQ4 homolog, mitochondrial n=1 Tax=Culicoides brevitarsis TaxID=469753 RepID=UPI00307BDE88
MAFPQTKTNFHRIFRSFNRKQVPVICVLGRIFVPHPHSTRTKTNKMLRKLLQKDLKAAVISIQARNHVTSHHEAPSSSSQEQEEHVEPDEFTKDFLKQRIPLTGFQQILLSAGSSLAAILNPARNDMISALGETTGTRALQKQYEIMMSTDEGQRILSQKPRINSRTIDLRALEKLPHNTFGYAYINFLKENEVHPDSRDPVQFIDDPKLAYIMTRYRESHDLVHTVLGMPTNMLGEVAVKWIEALNTGLPMCYGAAVFGSLRLRQKHRAQYKQYYLPWAMRMARNMKPLMPVFWEERWEQDLSALREELNIEVLVLPNHVKSTKKDKLL